MEKVGRVLHKEASVAIRHRCPPSTSQGGWGHRGPLQLILPNHPRVPPARIIHIEVNNLPSGRRLRPVSAGRRSGLALSPAAAAGLIIHEDTPFVNNAG